MKLYQIFTEDKNRTQVERLVGVHFSGFSIYPGTGYWKGIKEQSLCIKILAQDQYEHKANIAELCQEIKLVNAQENVLLLEEEVNARFI